MRFALYVLSAILAGSSFSVSAKLYKWVDENGQVHFSDRIPVEYRVKKHQELNNQGVVTKQKAAAKTPEQIAEEKRLERERKQALLEEKRQKQRDRVLLDTYTTERDLIVARDSRLDAVDSQINLSLSIINDSNKKIESMQAQVAQLQSTNREVPPDLFKRIRNEEQQVKVQSMVMQNHKRRREEIDRQFNIYIERFNILKEEQRLKREELARERGY